MEPLEGFKSVFNLPIPTSDLITWIYEDGECRDFSKPLYYDAADLSRWWNKSQARTAVRKIIAGLQAAGLQPGDCVMIHSFNDINYPLLVQGIVGAGGVFTGSNPSYTVSELEHHIKTAEVKFLISEPEIFDSAREAARLTDISRSNMWIFDNLPNQKVPLGQRSWRELLSHGEKDWAQFNSYKIASTTTVCRLFSSGTTGRPKAVELTHYNMIAQHVGVMTANRRPYDRIYVASLPCFHASATPFIHFQNIAEGNVVYLMRGFDLERQLHLIQTRRATEMIMVPAMVIMMIMHPATKKYDLSSIKSVLVGSAPLDKSIQDRLRNEVLSPGTRVFQAWGMTEVCCTGTMFFHPEDDDTASIGRPINRVELKLINDNEKEIRAYETPGELLIRGPNVTPGYFRSPAINMESFIGDFLRTGDIAYCSAKDKKWYIVDRKKELIKVRGFQVAPVEIEGVLLTHPHIIDAAIIGIPAPGPAASKVLQTKEATQAAAAGELVRAYVVRRPGVGSKLTENEILDYATTKLAKYKRITGGVVFVDELPKNANGKVLKVQLRERSKQEIAGRNRQSAANL